MPRTGVTPTLILVSTLGAAMLAAAALGMLAGGCQRCVSNILHRGGFVGISRGLMVGPRAALFLHPGVL